MRGGSNKCFMDFDNQAALNRIYDFNIESQLPINNDIEQSITQGSSSQPSYDLNKRFILRSWIHSIFLESFCVSTINQQDQVCSLFFKLNYIVDFQKAMQNIRLQPKGTFSRKKILSVKSVDNFKRTKRSLKLPDSNKMESIINELEKNLTLLKKHYFQQHYQQPHTLISLSKKINRPLSSQTCNINKINCQENPPFEDLTTIAEIDDVKKSFLSINGYQTNNIVQLYNFYKKNLERSTRLFGSTSMSNMINITQNHSEIRDRALRAASGITVLSQDQKEKQRDKDYERQIQKQRNKQNIEMSNRVTRLPVLQKNKLSLGSADTLNRKNEMVSVATILADKKKITRKNICQNMNTQNLLNQAKRKLHKCNTYDNIEQYNKFKENIRSENIRISPNKPKGREIKQRSTQKKLKSIKKENIIELSKNDGLYAKMDLQTLANQKAEVDKQVQKVSIFQARSAQKPQMIKEQQQFAPSAESKQEAKLMKSNKSSKSIKSIKSPPSVKSPSLNQAVLLDLSISNERSQNKGITPISYFIPKTHNMKNNDSLLDCEITPKDQSKVIDLQSIPFDF